jgi:predicted  nucleic acid-binding Zn-ribbon protein
MTPPLPAEQPNPQVPEPVSGDISAHDPEFAEAMTQVEAYVENLKQQYGRVEQARYRLKQAGKGQSQTPELQSEVNLLKTNLAELELTVAELIMSSLSENAQKRLEHLVQVGQRQEGFWQFIRYAGLGFAVGVGLKALIR